MKSLHTLPRSAQFFIRALNFNQHELHETLRLISITPKRYCKVLYKRKNQLIREAKYIREVKLVHIKGLNDYVL